jgi:glycosyltransferase involved in cell wall biosynthesis
MAAARPVIARRVGALPETVVHGETGLLIDDDEPESVARALETILGDRERGRAMGARGTRRRGGAVQRRTLGRDGRARLSGALVKILQLMSCRGWSSDAYWAARVTRELECRGHLVTLGCRAGTEARVIDRAAARRRCARHHLGAGGRRAPRLRRQRPSSPVRMLSDVDVVHVHRGKEHWLAAVANRLISTPRPLVRTRHIAQAVRPHAANRWLYRRGTAFVVTVTEAIRRQYVAAGLVEPDRVAALPGGADTERYHPVPRDPETYARLGGRPDRPLVGMIGGLRVMKGHATVVEAAARLVARGVRPHFVFVGRGPMEPAVPRRDRARRPGVAVHVRRIRRRPDRDARRARRRALHPAGVGRDVARDLRVPRGRRPLIAARVGVVPEVLTDREHAALVPAGDAEALAEAIERLLRHPNEAARLAEAGRRLVEERYSGARVAAAPRGALQPPRLGRGGVKVSVLAADLSDNATGPSDLLARSAGVALRGRGGRAALRRRGLEAGAGRRDRPAQRGGRRLSRLRASGRGAARAGRR